MNRERALEQVGEGWSILVNTFYSFVEVLNDHQEFPDPQIMIEEVSVDRGMLKIVASSTSVTTQEILDKLAWAIERDSAKVCEVCGKKGFRRKAIDGSPNRCQPHYIELMNKMAEEGKL